MSLFDQVVRSVMTDRDLPCRVLRETDVVDTLGPERTEPSTDRERCAGPSDRFECSDAFEPGRAAPVLLPVRVFEDA